MAESYGFTPEEMVVNENLGYPIAYQKLCRDRGFGPYSHGPPFTFMPYALQGDEAEKARDLEKMFPIICPKAKPSTKTKIFVGVLWKQLSHLGNAGFDPAVIRVDAYGNVLYYYADSASPLNWDIDHWFPYSRGGLTVVSNLRILQRQSCKRKKNKLEFLIPWWDFKLGISVNQFLSIFASSNSDFRHRAFSFLFSEGGDHELNASQIVDSHSFPQPFFELKEEIGLAPAAIVESRREPYDGLAIRQLDHNRKSRPMYPAIVASRKSMGKLLKENEDPDFDKNPYQAILVARDSLKKREENIRAQAEIQKLDDEMNEMKLKNEEEKLVIQDLELALIKRRRKAEKMRQLAEAQCSYRTTIEKMIRDAMHQSVVYKEQVRLNQAAANALMARLEAQREICDAAEKELHMKYKQRDELEKEIRTEWDEGRKRSRIGEDSILDESGRESTLYLPGIRPRIVLLEGKPRACQAGFSGNKEQKQEEKERARKITVDSNRDKKLKEHNRSLVALDEENSIEDQLEKLEISDVKRDCGISFSALEDAKTEEDEENSRQHCKGNVEKWLQTLVKNSHKDMDPQETSKDVSSETEEIIRHLNQKNRQQELKISKVLDFEYEEKQLQLVQDKNGWTERGDKTENEGGSESGAICTGNKSYTEEGACIGEGSGTTSFEGVERKEKKLFRSASAKSLRRIPSSPFLLPGIPKGKDCNGKNPIVSGSHDGRGYLATANSFFRSPIKTIKKAVKF